MNADIYLSELNRSDLSELHKWINDESLVGLSTVYKPVSDLEQERWFETYISAGNSYFFAIKKRNGAIIGTCQLTNVDPVARHAELRIRIGDSSNRGKGYGYRAVCSLLRYAFHTINLHRVWLSVFDFNERAAALYKKVGFQHEGTLRQAFFYNGAYHDVHIMGILSTEFFID